MVERGGGERPLPLVDLLDQFKFWVVVWAVFDVRFGGNASVNGSLRHKPRLGWVSQNPFERQLFPNDLRRTL